MKPANERRSRRQPILREDCILLSPSQCRTLHFLEESGWHLLFVRRSFYSDSFPVIENDFTDQTAIIDKCGHINTNHGLHFRESRLAPTELN